VLTGKGIFTSERLGNSFLAHIPLNIRNKTMKTSNDLFTLADVCNYYGLSESSIRRRVRQRREGIGNFPLPLFGSGCRVLWRKFDIENWQGEDAEVINFTPSLPLPAHQPIAIKSKAQVRKELEELGVRLPE
jgi:predicted DNA-binding transcriptional regulator AlpA